MRRGRGHDECGHDGWVAGCEICESEQALALNAMGDRPDDERTHERDDDDDD